MKHVFAGSLLLRQWQRVFGASSTEAPSPGWGVIPRFAACPEREPEGYIALRYFWRSRDGDR